MNSRKPSDIELLPSLDIISQITSLGSLNIADIESNIPNPINTKYYPSDFDKLALHVSSSPSYFSLFHVNLNSLDAHLGDLQTILALMNSPFHVLGISETKENYSSGFKMNNNLDGYILNSSPSRPKIFMLYYSLIYPFLNYAIQVWSLTYPTYLPLSTHVIRRLSGYGAHF